MITNGRNSQLLYNFVAEAALDALIHSIRHFTCMTQYQRIRQDMLVPVLFSSPQFCNKDCYFPLVFLGGCHCAYYCKYIYY